MRTRRWLITPGVLKRRVCVQCAVGTLDDEGNPFLQVYRSTTLTVRGRQHGVRPRDAGISDAYEMYWRHETDQSKSGVKHRGGGGMPEFMGGFL